jgi:adenosine deaminase
MVPCPGKNTAEVKKCISLSSPVDPKTFSKNSYYQITEKVLQQNQSIERSAFELVRSFIQNGDTYAEIVFNPLELTHQLLPQRDVVDAFISGIGRAKHDLKSDIVIRLILAISRHDDVKDAMSIVNTAMMYHGSLVSGITFRSDLNDYPLDKYLSVITAINKDGLPFFVESNDNNEIAAAITYGAKRIIGGLHICEEPNLVSIIKEKGILVLASMQEPFMTGKTDMYMSNPIVSMLKDELPVTLISSDSVLFDSNLKKEYQLSRDACFVSYDDCMKMENTAFSFKLA